MLHDGVRSINPGTRNKYTKQTSRKVDLLWLIIHARFPAPQVRPQRDEQRLTRLG